MKALFNAVQAHSEFDKQTFSDIANYGAGGGFGSFCYYNDTVKFFDDNRTIIMEAVNEMADSMGEDALVMIKGFNCLNGDYSTTEIAQGIYEADSDSATYVKNALAWFALEEVARAVDDGQLDDMFEDDSED